MHRLRDFVARRDFIFHGNYYYSSHYGANPKSSVQSRLARDAVNCELIICRLYATFKTGISIHMRYI